MANYTIGLIGSGLLLSSKNVESEPEFTKVLDDVFYFHTREAAEELMEAINLDNMLELITLNEEVTQEEIL